jgi:UV DNA damage repair endonuclease
MLSFSHREIRRILTDTWQRQGWQVPDHITNYETQILASMLNRVPWQPEPSYAERFLTIRTVEEYIDFGNVCWFTRAVFPQCLERRGMTESYFVQLGQSAYDTALKRIDSPIIEQMRDYFEWTAEMAYTAIHAEGEFRSMWD